MRPGSRGAALRPMCANAAVCIRVLCPPSQKSERHRLGERCAKQEAAIGELRAALAAGRVAAAR